MYKSRALKHRTFDFKFPQNPTSVITDNLVKDLSESQEWPNSSFESAEAPRKNNLFTLKKNIRMKKNKVQKDQGPKTASVRSLKTKNTKLNQKNQKLKDTNKDLITQLKKVNTQSFSKYKADILKYARFMVNQSLCSLEFNKMIHNRVEDFNQFLREVENPEKHGKCLLVCLQAIGDMLVQEIHRDKTPLQLESNDKKKCHTFINKYEKDNFMDCINAQSERILKMKQQISESIKN